jgi:hypothetical protein
LKNRGTGEEADEGAREDANGRSGRRQNGESVGISEGAAQCPAARCPAGGVEHPQRSTAQQHDTSPYHRRSQLCRVVQYQKVAAQGRQQRRTTTAQGVGNAGWQHVGTQEYRMRAGRGIQSCSITQLGSSTARQSCSTAAPPHGGRRSAMLRGSNANKWQPKKMALQRTDIGSRW